jgi:hypothetical protein
MKELKKINKSKKKKRPIRYRITKERIWKICFLQVGFSFNSCKDLGQDSISGMEDSITDIKL